MCARSAAQRREGKIPCMHRPIEGENNQHRQPQITATASPCTPPAPASQSRSTYQGTCNPRRASQTPGSRCASAAALPGPPSVASRWPFDWTAGGNRPRAYAPVCLALKTPSKGSFTTPGIARVGGHESVLQPELVQLQGRAHDAVQCGTDLHVIVH
jgi:hypothetical protein